jgi:hypothetical protein
VKSTQISSDSLGGILLLFVVRRNSGQRPKINTFKNVQIPIYILKWHNTNVSNAKNLSAQEF